MRKIDMETVAFMKEIEELVKQSRNGIKSFDEATRDNFDDYVFYDPATKKDEKYRIVDGAELNELHHDAYSYLDGWVVIDDGVVESEESGFHIEYEQNDYCIVIDNGEWYFT